MRLSSIFALLALSTTSIAMAIVRIPSNQPAEDTGVSPELLEAAIAICKNRKMFRKTGPAHVDVTCNSNQILTCRALFGLCISATGVVALTPADVAILPFMAAFGTFLSSCQSGPSYCGNCFDRISSYNGICNDSPQIRMFIQDQISIVPKERLPVEIAHGTPFSNWIKGSEPGDNQEISESRVDETAGTSKTPASIATSDLDALAPDKPTDGKLLAESTPLYAEHGATEDPVLDIGTSSGVESGKEDPRTKSTSSNLNNPENENILSANDNSLMSTK